jgi:hypothetical protein
MLLANITSTQTRTLVVIASLLALLTSGFLGLSVRAIARHSEPQQHDFGTFVSIPKAGPLCQRIVFDNYTSQIVSSGNVQCRPEDLAHDFQAPLASLRRGFSSK